MTDSGGVQEEASSWAGRCVVARRSTERPEVLGTFATLVDPADGDRARPPRRSRPTSPARTAGSPASPSPYGDGHAGGADRRRELAARFARATARPTRRYDAARGRRDASVPERLSPRHDPSVDPAARHSRPRTAASAARVTPSRSASAPTSSTARRPTASSRCAARTAASCTSTAGPVAAELDRIYPDHYHAFAFTEDRFGFVYSVRRRLEARRLLQRVRGPARRRARSSTSGAATASTSTCSRASARRAGASRASTSTTAPSAPRAGAASPCTAAGRGARPRPRRRYDGALLIQTIEHLPDPAAVLARGAAAPQARRAGARRHRQHRLARLPHRPPPALGRLPLPAPLVPVRRAVAAPARGDRRASRSRSSAR